MLPLCLIDSTGCNDIPAGDFSVVQDGLKALYDFDIKFLQVIFRSTDPERFWGQTSNFACMVYLLSETVSVGHSLDRSSTLPDERIAFLLSVFQLAPSLYYYCCCIVLLSCCWF
jgi:hypothetical protein